MFCLSIAWNAELAHQLQNTADVGNFTLLLQKKACQQNGFPQNWIETTIFRQKYRNPICKKTGRKLNHTRVINEDIKLAKFANPLVNILCIANRKCVSFSLECVTLLLNRYKCIHYFYMLRFVFYFLKVNVSTFALSIKGNTSFFVWVTSFICVLCYLS